MRMRDVKRLLSYWADSPPAHVGVLHVRDVVISGLGGKPPERKGHKPKKASAEELAAMFGMTLPVKEPVGG